MWAEYINKDLPPEDDEFFVEAKIVKEFANSKPDVTEKELEELIEWSWGVMFDHNTLQQFLEGEHTINRLENGRPIFNL